MIIGGQNLIAIRRGVVYEGHDHQLWAIHPLPLIVPAILGGLTCHGYGRNMVFREDVFDPLTRIRRGRFYEMTGRSIVKRSVSSVSNGLYGPLVGISNNEFDADDNGSIASVSDVDHARREIVILGFGAAKTYWRVIDVEQNLFGHQVFSLRAKSLFGVIPELNDLVADQDGRSLGNGSLSEVRQSLAALLDTYHRFQSVPTVDAARETARVILSEWIGSKAKGKDLGAVINLIPNDRNVIRSAAFVVNRLHPRGKSAERETQESKGVALRETTNEDAETSVRLVGMILSEIGWDEP